MLLVALWIADRLSLLLLTSPLRVWDAGTADQMYTLGRELDGSQEFSCQIHLGFVDLETAFDLLPHSVQWEELWECGVWGPLLQSSSSACISGKSNLFPVHIGPLFSWFCS